MLPDIRPLLLETILLSQAVDRLPLRCVFYDSVNKACMGEQSSKGSAKAAHRGRPCRVRAGLMQGE